MNGAPKLWLWSLGQSLTQQTEIERSLSINANMKQNASEGTVTGVT